MGVIRFLRAHVDSVVAILLAAAYLAEVLLAETSAVGEPFVAGLEGDEALAIAAAISFLLSLALRNTLPLVPLGLAYVALAAAGSGQLDGVLSLAAGLVLAVYSVGAWTDGRAGLVGAVGVGGLAGAAVLRASGDVVEAQDLAVPVLFLVGAWLLGLAARSLRADRGDERLVGELDWEAEAAAADTTGRDETVRELRDIVERSMSAVILQSRTARAALDAEPAGARKSLDVIEAAGTEALEETQRLTSLLLAPDGAATLEPQTGLAALDLLAEQVTAAGLPVDMRVEGRPVPLTPDLDGVAYRVVHQALMNTLENAAASHSSVVIRYEPDELQVEVTDDGLSLEEEVEDETAGLLAARNEVAVLGGTLDAGPGEERGYWVLARLPYEPDEDDRLI